MNKSEKIRELHAQGMKTADIARKLDIRYQFARNVIVASFGQPTKTEQKPRLQERKSALTTERLLAGGFSKMSHWKISGNQLQLDTPLPKAAGVYAFSIDGVVQYVGVATTTLAKRCAFYIKPGPTQTTSQRLNTLLLKLIQQKSHIEIYTISVADCAWNGWKIDGNLGLEGGLIANFDLPWNKRGASPFLSNQ